MPRHVLCRGLEKAWSSSRQRGGIRTPSLTPSAARPTTTDHHSPRSPDAVFPRRILCPYHVSEAPRAPTYLHSNIPCPPLPCLLCAFSYSQDLHMSPDYTPLYQCPLLAIRLKSYVACRLLCSAPLVRWVDTYLLSRYLFLSP